MTPAGQPAADSREAFIGEESVRGVTSRGALDADIIIANAPDPVFVSDLEGKILQSNEAVSALLGLRPHELLEQSLSRFIGRRLGGALSPCDALESGDEEQRRAALFALARRADPEAVAVLRWAAAGRDPDLALAAALALDEIKERVERSGAVPIYSADGRHAAA